ncbi:hypothetical protein GDO78_012166 [Eleutherodactylus coqui]|uniref:Uncharacterized protein n=1 Tax=Eleutherodactylus coqui TaxID=57060 RepID=A0A8J6F3T9_ELECQ|nr:hypothetical protein GDO78_012166 [Eleutherodactylus coqui]
MASFFNKAFHVPRPLKGNLWFTELSNRSVERCTTWLDHRTQRKNPQRMARRHCGTPEDVLHWVNAVCLDLRDLCCRLPVIVGLDRKRCCRH